MAADSSTPVPFTTHPPFEAEASDMALRLAGLTTDEMERMLRVNHALAAENRLRYCRFHDADNRPLPALLAYTGIVFKHMAPEDFTPDDFRYAQEHLNITSFLYGLLRPLDLIRNYRLEGDAVLPGHAGLNQFAYWQPRLTDVLLERIHADDGILLNLASEEMKRLFDWKRITREAKVVTPDFRVRKGDKLRTIVVYAKMCRGEMARYVLKERLASPEALKGFAWEGFRWDEAVGKFVL